MYFRGVGTSEPNSEKIKMKEQPTTSEVRTTNLGPCYLRSFSNIPYSMEMANAVDAKRAVEIYWKGRTKIEVVAPYMEARYKALDALVKRSGVKQVLELAAGWSPRGMIMALGNPQASYIETDQSPEELDKKREIISQLIGNVPSNLHHVTFDVLKEDGLENVLALLKREPTAVIHEGLFRYFSHPLKDATIAKIHSILTYTNGGIYATPDIHTREVELEAFRRMNPKMDEIDKEHSEKTKTDIDGNYFKDHNEAKACFERPGFNVNPHTLGDFLADFSCLRHPELDREVLERAVEITKTLPVWEMTLK